MKSKEIVKLLFPGVIAGMVLGFGLGMLVGVNPTDPKPNYIGGAICCLVPTLLNCIVVLKLASKGLKRTISFGAVLKRALPLIICAAIVGLLTYVVVIEKVMGLNCCELGKVTNAVIQAALGIVTSTLGAYIAVKKYIKDVKYTKRK